MSNNNTVMKTTLFGGFKKADVLAYIETLQSENNDIKKKLNEKSSESDKLSNKIAEFENKLAELNKVNLMLAEKEKEVTDLTSRLGEVIAENSRYREQLDEYQNKSERLARAEKQIGAAYIDARRYSDALLDDARGKAKDIGAIASQDIKREANEIEMLLKEIDVISRKFNSSLEQIHKDVYALGAKLNTSASALLNINTDLAELGFSNDVNIDIPVSDSDDSYTVASYHSENQNTEIDLSGFFDKDED
ncbi:MAG: hypothetical protein J1F23_01545 [Oscillospiraceae bacterium]|nr:hypothetical protein [Oscillospiraceae bacterium]